MTERGIQDGRQIAAPTMLPQDCGNRFASLVREVAKPQVLELNFVCAEYLMPYLTYIKENKEVFATALANVQPPGATF